MSRPTIPLAIEDVSAFSRALAQQLRAAEGSPSHLSLLNMLARSSGFRNFQHLRAASTAAAKLSAAPPIAAGDPVDHVRVARALKQFDATGRLRHWHSRRALQELCLWALWARFPARDALGEAAVNRHLNAWHVFGDPALLRRELFDFGLVTRNADGSDYRRIERQPPATARELIRHLAARG